jgi:protein involved in polysaccharide export with SLBB domain
MTATYRLCGFILLLALVMAAGGCRTDFGATVIEPDPIAPSRVASKIQPGDRIKMMVHGEQDLSGFYDVSPTGSVTLPLAGTIRAAGLTRAELERAVTRRYAPLLEEPKIAIDVVEFRPFYILGEAEKPGQYPYQSGLNVLTAIATAGGLTFRASRSTVLVQHAGESVWREYAMTSDVLVAPGDLIRIPPRYF